MADRPAAQAVDQEGTRAVHQGGLVDGLLLGNPQNQGPVPHDPGQAAAAEGRGDPARSRSQHQVGGGAAAEFAAAARQQGVIGSGGLGLAPGLNRGPIGKGFALAQQTGGTAPFGGAHDHPHRVEIGLVGVELQPKAVGTVCLAWIA